MIGKLKFISKCMTSQTGKQIITIHILPNISRSKGNQTMELGQLIENNMVNIFLEKSYTKCGEKLVPDSFIKNQYLWIHNRKCYTVCFLLYVEVESL